MNFHNIYDFFFLQHSGQRHTVRSVHRFFMRAKIWYGLSQLSAQ